MAAVARPELAALLAEAEAIELELARRRGVDVVPALYTAFVASLGVRLTRAQRVICRVAFDGVEPQDLEGDDRELARTIFGDGDVDVIPSAARKVIVAVCGARAGKTYILEALRLLHLALTVPLPMLAPGEVASCPIIQPDKDLAQQALNYIRGALKSRPELAAMVPNRGELEAGAGESIDVVRPDGARVEIVVRAASARGRTGRGRTLVAAGLGEAAFFRDKDYRVNDEEIYRALTPRVVVGGQTIVSSTPFAQLGLLHELFAANHPNPSVAGLTSKPVVAGKVLALHAPTLLLRDDDPNLREIVDAEYQRDPDNALREYGAQFMGAGTSAFFDPVAINAAIVEELELPILPEPNDVVSAGGDTGFAKNSSTLAIAHRRGARYRLAELYERKAAPGTLLKPSEVVFDFADVMARHGGKFFMADGHYKASVHEHLEAHHRRAKELAEERRLPPPVRVSFVDAPALDEAAFRVNALLREGLVEIPNHPRLLRQLRETLKRPRPGGGFSIVLPKWQTGEHGDLANAFILAVYQAYGFKVPEPPPKQGTDAWEEREADRRRAESRAKVDRRRRGLRR